MYMVVVAFKNGDAIYFGPFPSHARAAVYGAECYNSYKDDKRGYTRWFTLNLVIPYTVVKKIEWRE